VFENHLHFLTSMMEGKKKVLAHKNVFENYKLVERKGRV